MLEKFLKNNLNNSESIENINAPHEVENIDIEVLESFKEKIKKNEEEIKNLKQHIKTSEKEVVKLSQLLASKEKILMMQNKKLSSNEEELTGYINKIFEQQERERIVKWIVNCIRESLDIDNVLKTTVEEIGKLLKSDRCLIALYDEKKQKFLLKGEYRDQNRIESIVQKTDEIKILPEWQKLLVRKNQSVVVNDIDCSSNAIKGTQNSDVKSFALTPVVHKGNILGLIVVQQVDSPREWKEHHIEILKYIGTQIAIAIRQASYYTDIKKQKDREILLRTIISTIRSSLDINEVKRKVVTETGVAFNADRCSIRLYDKNENNFVFDDVEYDVYSRKEEDKASIFKNHKGCMFTKLYKEGKVLAFDNLDKFISDMDINQTDKAKYFSDLEIKTFVIVPIIFSQNVLGTLALHYCETNPKVDEDTIELLKTIASQLGLAIGQIQLYENLNKTVQREATMSKIVTKIRSTLDIDEVLSSICEEISKLFNFDRVAIIKYQKNNIQKKWKISKEYKVHKDFKGFDRTKIDSLVGDFWEEILFEKKLKINAYNIEDYNFPKHIKVYYEDLNIKSLLALPIEKEGDKWGGLFLTNHCNEKKWSEEEVQLLETIIDQLYIAIRQAHLYSESEKTNKLKSEFLASMSHEFRTPLNAIIGFSEILSTGTYGNLTAKQFEYLNNISVSGTHLLRLVNDILDLSKIESGNMEISLEDFNSLHIINETASILESMALKKNIEIKLEVESIIISSDSRRFRQIMYNLISNAIKFTENNGYIKIKSYKKSEKLRVEVIDTGIGISRENRDRIFSQFAQIDSSYTRKQEGTGLGLTLTKKLVELLEGNINVESEEGKGSKFWFDIPGIINK